MATIDDRRIVREVDAAGSTVSQAHHAVRVARLKAARHGRTRAVHRGRRARCRSVSQYRPAGVSDASAAPLPKRNGLQRSRRLLRTVVIATVALSLLYAGFLRAFEPELNDKALVLGIYVIAVTAAVCLNAFTLDAMRPTAGIRSGSSLERGNTTISG